MGKAVTSRLPTLLSILLFISKSYALSDKNDYEYIFGIDQAEGDLNIDAGMKFGFGEISDIEVDTVDNLRPSLNIGYAFYKNHKIEIGTSYNMVTYGPWSYVDIDIAESTTNINLSYNYLKNVNSFQLLLGSHFSIPLFKSSEYLEESLYTQGTRRYTAGVSFALTRQIMNHTPPNIIWNVGMEYDIGLPLEDNYTSWNPGTIKMMGNLALHVNQFRLVAGIQQILSFPQGNDIACYTVLNSGILISHNNNFFLLAGSIPVIWLQEQFTPKPFTLGSLIYGHKFNLRK
jgi:hypothetical protein